MQAETLEYRKIFVESFNPPSNLLAAFDLPVLINNIKMNKTWRMGDLYNIVIMKDSGKQILLTAIHGGTEISYFRSEERLTIQTIEGCLRYNSFEGSGNITKGQVFELNERIEYTVTSNEEAIFLLMVLKRKRQLTG